MKKAAILAVLFFGTVWGVSEVFLGEALYRSDAPYRSVPLCLVALVVLTVARSRFPRAGIATAIACCAVGYKAVAMLASLGGTPYYPCHLLGIFTLGAAYDLAFSVLPRTKLNRSVRAVTAAYLGYALFAFGITYVFRYGPWIAGGISKVGEHIFVSGSMTALGGAILVPLVFGLAESLKRRGAGAVLARPALSAGGLLVTVALWVVAVVVPF